MIFDFLKAELVRGFKQVQYDYRENSVLKSGGYHVEEDEDMAPNEPTVSPINKSKSEFH